MKKLFKVVDTKDKMQKPLESFENKLEAKKFRDEKNKDSDYMRFRVCRGKEHWRRESFVNSKNVEAETPKKVKNERKKAKRDAAKEHKSVLVEPERSGENQPAG